MKRTWEWSGKDKRCVHLDFHTSELIEDIGAKFDRAEFAETLKKAGLDSITLFAKCHHGCFYYKDSKFFVHPHLTCSLLDEQIAACKEAGVSSKIYISAGFDEYALREHPEWMWIPSMGDDYSNPKPHFWKLCFNTPYLEYLKEQTREVVKKYKPDGVFFDIVSNLRCYCKDCLAEMERRGMDPNNEQDAWDLSVDVMNR